jgi:hypothetical protein
MAKKAKKAGKKAPDPTKKVLDRLKMTKENQASKLMGGRGMGSKKINKQISTLDKAIEIFQSGYHGADDFDNLLKTKGLNKPIKKAIAEAKKFSQWQGMSNQVQNKKARLIALEDAKKMDDQRLDNAAKAAHERMAKQDKALHSFAMDRANWSLYQRVDETYPHLSPRQKDGIVNDFLRGKRKDIMLERELRDLEVKKSELRKRLDDEDYKIMNEESLITLEKDIARKAEKEKLFKESGMEIKVRPESAVKMSMNDEMAELWVNRMADHLDKTMKPSEVDEALELFLSDRWDNEALEQILKKSGFNKEELADMLRKLLE